RVAALVAVGVARAGAGHHDHARARRALEAADADRVRLAGDRVPGDARGLVGQAAVVVAARQGRARADRAPAEVHRQLAVVVGVADVHRRRPGALGRVTEPHVLVDLRVAAAEVAPRLRRAVGRRRDRGEGRVRAGDDDRVLAGVVAGGARVDAEVDVRDVEEDV